MTRNRNFGSGSLREKDRSKAVKTSDGGGVKPKSPFHFIMTVANMVKTPNMPTVYCKLRKKWDLKETFLFLRLHSGKENIHIPSQLLDTLFP